MDHKSAPKEVYRNDDYVAILINRNCHRREVTFKQNLGKFPSI